MTQSNELLIKKEKLNQYFYQLLEKGDICIAFSGGVDSSVLLKTATDQADKLNRKVYAITFQTVLHTQADLINAKNIASKTSAIHNVIEINELDNEQLLNNPIDRCYICKNHLFGQMMEYAKRFGVEIFVEGTNRDDLDVYRPGIKAVKELGVHSPLAELEIRKAEVRELARLENLEVASRPSTPCMATRLPYNTRITEEILERIKSGEEVVRAYGYQNVRVRLHGDIARIEIDFSDFTDFLIHKEEIAKKLKELGFRYITLDMEGFRSGSMDIFE
ncbi:ATP-dependent sacrificial sulfur transferase LarE [Anaeromicropila herbilytica]|uniref:Adenine nucleotide alpha hydrolase n=1 Tax=Anaeromicropila herbilytica TaxID=2785025 RepID=A0A7R7IBA2_9FIRM|nr:ATP-dependent sacrificial sulfur transferase LarE [Anaeromicropila herbilytica]BCN29358.1 adenine nucleotide alpha hydrolase [Anaeromicropila herbilytica]